jgi:hypothetical protein
VTSNLTVKVGVNIDELQKGLSKANAQLSTFNKSVTAIGTSLSAAFAGASIASVASFGLEVSKLAGEAQGVKAAFDRLPESIKLMDDLKRATGGTVSELDLMKRSVQASNFGISLGALPKLLEFATLRAQQTGQSVDYLVDSIITGIGRKSPLILDNLGISAVALKQKLGGISSEAATVGDVADAVGKIASESLGKMAGFAENASTKIQRLSASWENAKVAIGNAANSTGAIGAATDTLTLALNGASSTNLNFFEKIALFASGGIGGLASGGLLDRAREIDKVREAAEKLKGTTPDVDPITGLPLNGQSTPWQKQIQTLESLKAQLDTLNKQFAVTDTNDQKKLKNIAGEINLTEKLIKKIEDLTSHKKKEADVNGLDKWFKDAAVSNGSLLDLTPVTKVKTFKDGPLSKVAMDMEKVNQSVKKSAAGINNSILGIGKQFLDMSPVIESGLEGLTVGLANVLGDLASGMGSVNDFGAALLGGIGAMATQLGELAIATGITVSGIKAALEDLNPAVAIAAGIALVVLGRAVSNKARSIGSGGGRSGGSVGTSSPALRDTLGNGKKTVVAMPEGQWRIDGRDLVYVVEKNQALDKKRKS